jgi:hypothetical protein
MGVLENPGKYTMVIAENEEQSPWEPLHVEHGFNKQDSTVTLFFPNSFTQLWPYGSDDKGILSAILYNLIPSRSGLFCLVLPPSRAKPVAEKGWTKKEIAIFLSEYGRVPHTATHLIGEQAEGIFEKKFHCPNRMQATSWPSPTSRNRGMFFLHSN